jgi:hypothetical protein
MADKEEFFAKRTHWVAGFMLADVAAVADPHAAYVAYFVFENGRKTA